MCGIIGYIGNRKVESVLINGLKRMEYRGYDSSGICLGNSTDNLLSKKKKGRVVELENFISKYYYNSESMSYGIGHTRWATHGKPNDTNAHPHSNKTNSISVVHNGIIENYLDLKDELIKDGYEFQSETDTEVIVHLLDKYYFENLELTVRKILPMLVGAYGLAIISKTESKIIVVKNGSPIVLGINDDEKFVASDISAILEYTKNIIYLEDGELAVLSKDKFYVSNFNGSKIDKEIEKVNMSLDEIEKNGYDHFMLKEIFDQPKSIKDTLRGRIVDKQIKLNLDIDFLNINKIHLVACGTSWHSGLIGKYYFEELNRLPTEVFCASEYRYSNPIIDNKTLVIFLSQSGETADTLAALHEAKSKQAKTVGFVNVVGSSIARKVDSVIYLNAGPEISVASTKAFTTQVVNLLLLSLYISQKRNGIINIDILKSIENLSNDIDYILDESNKIKSFSNLFEGVTSSLYLGRNLSYPVALEGALKLKEISYVHAEGYPSGEMKHGPIALIDSMTPIVAMAPNDFIYEKIYSNLEEAKARSGKIILFTTTDYNDQGLTNHVFKIPKTNRFVQPILSVIPMQLLSYYVAVSRNLDVDKPRNLAKAVTVE